MEKNEKSCLLGRLWSPALGAGLLVALGLLLMGLCQKAGIDNFATRDRTVAVKGLAEKEVPANKVTWPIVVKFTGDDLQGLYAQVQTSNQAVLGFLKSNGVIDSEIAVNSPQVQDMKADQYANQNIPYTYIVTSVITVTSTQVEKVRKLINNQSELMRQGIAVVAGDYNYPTLYEFTDLNSIKPQMVQEATKNARESAEKFAEDSKSKLGKIKTASQGQFSIEDRDQFTPYIKKVRVVSTVEYYLKD